MRRELATQPKAVAMTHGPTLALASWAAGFRLEHAPSELRIFAHSCVLDWIGVTLASRDEPLRHELRAVVLEEGGAPRATLLGSRVRTSMRQAALVNGTAGHALDYDDVHRAMRGHPTAPVLPAVLAVAEGIGASGERAVAAFIVGVEVTCRVGRYVGNSHYEHGWHATATLGAIGAAAAVGHLLGLDAVRIAHAIGLGATQAAGLKSMFGTMAKPLHAGKAAENGVLAGLLAARGFTSRPDTLETAQGFGATQSQGVDAAACTDGLGARWFLPQILFKYHACCYGVHPSVECCIALRDAHGLTLDDVAQVELRVPEHCLRTCNIAEPATGLEGKFSLRMAAAMAIAGVDMSDPATFTDALMHRPDLVALRRRVTVTPDERFTNTAAAEARITTRGNAVLLRSLDLELPAEDPDAQWRRLAVKFQGLSRPILGEDGSTALQDVIAGLDASASIAPLIAACIAKGERA